MRICVPLETSETSDIYSVDSRSLKLAAHFGVAKRFAIIDSDEGIIVNECRVEKHCSGPCHCPLPDFSSMKVDALAGGAIGYRLMQISRRAAVPVFATTAGTLGDFCNEIHQSMISPVALKAKCLKPAARCGKG